MPRTVVYDKQWIGGYFDDWAFELPDGSVWKILSKISEKALLFPDRTYTVDGYSDTSIDSTDSGGEYSSDESSSVLSDGDEDTIEKSVSGQSFDWEIVNSEDANDNNANDNNANDNNANGQDIDPGRIIPKFTHMDEDGQPAEAQAVYHCCQMEGDEVGKEAIMKIRTQTHPDFYTTDTPDERARLATDGLCLCAYQEMAALTFLTRDNNCSVTPKLLGWDLYEQMDDRMWIPGGYLLVVIMEKVPGQSLLYEFWDRPDAECERIRASLRRALTELYALGAIIFSPDRKNIFYDDKEDKCYIIDYEQVKISIGPDEEFRTWDDSEWDLWSMAERMPEPPQCRTVYWLSFGHHSV